MKTKLFIFLIILFGISNFTTICSQPVHQEWVDRCSKSASDLYTPFFALDKNGNSFVAGIDGSVFHDSVISVIKYNRSGVQLWKSLYNYPGFQDFDPTGLALDTSGNPVVISDFGPDFLHVNRILLVKFNSIDGQVNWARTFLGNNIGSYPYDLKIDKQNNIYVAGWLDSSSACIKADANGNTIWIRKWQPPGDYAAFYNCALDDSLNIILTGYRSHCVSLPPPGGCFDSLLTVKYSPDGDLRWVKTYWFPQALGVGGFGQKIVVDQFGNSYIGAKALVTGYHIYLMVKYDLNGNQQWVSSYSASSDSFLKSIALDRIHNFVFVSGYLSNGFDYGTVKYNTSTGDSLWFRRYHGSGGYLGNSTNDIKIDGEGNAYVTGTIHNAVTGNDIVTVKYSQQGNEVWVESYNDPNNLIDAAYSLMLDDSNSVYVNGLSQYQTTNPDYITIKYSQVNGIKKISDDIPRVFSLSQNFPNPFNPATAIKFDIPKDANLTFQIYDVLGRLVATLAKNEFKKAGSYEITWDATNFTSGVYFYRITAGTFTDTKKMVIVK